MLFVGCNRPCLVPDAVTPFGLQGRPAVPSKVATTMVVIVWVWHENPAGPLVRGGRRGRYSATVPPCCRLCRSRRCSHPRGRCWANDRYVLELVDQKGRLGRTAALAGYSLLLCGRLVSYSEETAFFRFVSKAKPHEALQVERGRELVRWKCVGVECAHVLKSVIFGLLVGQFQRLCDLAFINAVKYRAVVH